MNQTTRTVFKLKHGLELGLRPASEFETELDDKKTNLSFKQDHETLADLFEQIQKDLKNLELRLSLKKRYGKIVYASGTITLKAKKMVQSMPIQTCANPESFITRIQGNLKQYAKDEKFITEASSKIEYIVLRKHTNNYCSVTSHGKFPRKS
jgi:hypothetical protein